MEAIYQVIVICLVVLLGVTVLLIMRFAKEFARKNNSAKEIIDTMEQERQSKNRLLNLLKSRSL